MTKTALTQLYSKTLEVTHLLTYNVREYVSNVFYSLENTRVILFKNDDV